MCDTLLFTPEPHVLLTSNTLRYHDLCQGAFTACHASCVPQQPLGATCRQIQQRRPASENLNSELQLSFSAPCFGIVERCNPALVTMRLMQGRYSLDTADHTHMICKEFGDS